jgi:hypothetical protein
MCFHEGTDPPGQTDVPAGGGTGGGGVQATHLAFWFGSVVGHYVPSLAAGVHTARPPGPLAQVGDTLVEIFSFGTVNPNGLARAKTASIYAAFIEMPPPPKVEAIWPLDWGRVWRRLWNSGLPPPMADRMFKLVHNILSPQGSAALHGGGHWGGMPALRGAGGCGPLLPTLHTYC